MPEEIYEFIYNIIRIWMPLSEAPMFSLFICLGYDIR